MSSRPQSSTARRSSRLPCAIGWTSLANSLHRTHANLQRWKGDERLTRRFFFLLFDRRKENSKAISAGTGSGTTTDQQAAPH